MRMDLIAAALTGALFLGSAPAAWSGDRLGPPPSLQQLAQAASTRGPTPPGAPLKVTLLTPLGYLLAYTGLIYGEGGGYFRQAGLDATVQAAQGSSQAIQLVLSGQALAARGAGIDVMVAAANSNVPVVSFATILHIAPLHIISTAEAPIRGPADMAGKTVGVSSFGGATDQTLSLILAAGKIDPKSVKRQVVGPTAASFGLLQQKAVDAFIGTDAAVAELRSRGVPFHSFLAHDLVPVPGQVYITTVENLTRKREELIRFLRGDRWALEDVISQVDNNDIGRLLEAVKKYNVPEAPNPRAALEGLRPATASWQLHGKTLLLKNHAPSWEIATKAAIEAGVIKDAPASKFFTDEVWNAAFPQ